MATLYTSGIGDYTTIAAWLASLPATLTQNETLDCYDDAGQAHSESQIDSSGITTASDKKIIVQAATGHEYDYRDNTGFRVEISQSWGPAWTGPDSQHIELHKIGLINTHGTANDIFFAGNLVAKRCFFETQSTHASADGVRCAGGLIESCVIKGGNGTGRAGGYGIRHQATSGLADLVSRNCTIVGMDNAFENGGTSFQQSIQNCIVHDCDDSYDIATNIDTGNSFNNASHEASTVTPPGSNPYGSDIVDGDFVDYANGDYSLAQGHALNTAGGDPGVTFDSYGGALQSGTFSIGAHVYFAADQAPTRDSNVETVGVKDEDVTIAQADLEWTDNEVGAASLVYTLKTAPSYGTLKLNGTALNVNDTFTQADINAGNVAYRCTDETAEIDYITYDLSDGTNTVFGNWYHFHLVARIPEDHPIATQTVLTWIELSSSTIDSAQDSNLHNGLAGGSNAGLRTAWSGGCKYKSWITWNGGGHNDCYDNGWYGLDLENYDNGVVLMGGRSLNADIDDSPSTQYNADNRPQATHTYDTLISFPVEGYIMKCGLIGPGIDGDSHPYVEKFVPDNSDWELPSTLPDLPSNPPKGCMIRSADNVAWLLPRSTIQTNKVLSWKPGDSVWTEHGSFATMSSSTHMTGALAHNARKVFTFGNHNDDSSTIKALEYDISSGHGSTSTISPTDITGSCTGDTEILDETAPTAHYWRGKIYLHGRISSPADVYEFDPETYAITKLTLDPSNAITPDASQDNGSYHAFDLFGAYGGSVGTRSTTSPIYSLKLFESYTEAAAPPDPGDGITGYEIQGESISSESI